VTNATSSAITMLFVIGVFILSTKALHAAFPAPIEADGEEDED
jgi:hypothetical protein